MSRHGGRHREYVTVAEALIEESGMTKTQVQNILGVSQQGLYWWLTRVNAMPLDKVDLLCDVLEVDEDEIMGDFGYLKPTPAQVEKEREHVG